MKPTFDPLINLPLYLPNHPADPMPPTLYNRFLCRVHGHALHLSHFDFANFSAHLICLRCSRYQVVSNPAITLPSRAAQH